MKILWTDGSAVPNPGKGGFGCILVYVDSNGQKHEKEISEGYEYTTNNQMELTAAIEALNQLKVPCEVTLYSDSAYLINCFTNNWLDSWKKKNWVNSKREAVKNRDLWEELDRLSQIHKITWIKVKGHADNQYNNRCDELARSEISN